MNIETIKEYARYNLWANKKIAEALNDLSDKAWHEPYQSSFGSVGETVVHIMWAEKLWTERLKDKISKNIDPPDSNDRESVMDLFLQFSEEFTELVVNFNMEELNIQKGYSTMSGRGYSNFRYLMIHHCINHSTYHRGQLILMMRQNGIEAVPSTDFITYLNLESENT
jgi:uncharacterized damage-inducible protein DinB